MSSSTPLLNGALEKARVPWKELSQEPQGPQVILVLFWQKQRIQQTEPGGDGAVEWSRCHCPRPLSRNVF